MECATSKPEEDPVQVHAKEPMYDFKTLFWPVFWEWEYLSLL